MKDFLEMTESSIVIGAYAPDGEAIFQKSNSLEICMDRPFERFIPLITGFSRDHRCELEIVDPVDRETKIGTYDRNNPMSTLTEEIIKSKYIDVTRNDLSFSSDIVVLNFTGKAITMCNDKGVIKMYAPIENVNLESHKGNIYILEVTSLNNSDFVSHYFDDPNYINTLVQRYNQKLNKGSTRDFVKTLNIYTKAKEVYDNVINTDHTFSSNSIKVINIFPIMGDYIYELNRGREIHIKEYKALMSMRGPSEIGENKYIETEFNMTSNVVKLLSENNITCYINDPNDEIGDRYTYIVGSVIKIPKISDKSQSPKFYMRFSGLDVPNKNDKMENGLIEIPLSEIDKLPHIYKTIEDVVEGANREMLVEKEFSVRESVLRNEKLQAESELILKRKEIEKLKLDMEAMKTKNEIDRSERKDNYDEKKYVREVELEREKAKLAREKEQWDIEREKLKSDLARSNYIHEREMNSIKYQQENHKTNNEAVLQTLKTVGGVVALAAVGYTIYKKLN